MLGDRLLVEPWQVIGGWNIGTRELTADGSWLTVRQIPGVALTWNRIVLLRIARGIFGHIALSQPYIRVIR